MVVQVQGVPAAGVIDSGSDITIMGAELFAKVAVTACLHKTLGRQTESRGCMTSGHSPWMAG